MAKKLFVSFLMLIVSSFSTLAQAQCKPTGKQRTGNAIFGAAVGAGLGAFIGGGKGAAIGAMSGAGAGALTARDSNCVREARMNEYNRAEQARNPYNKRIARADAAEWYSTNGPSVIIDKVIGARFQEIKPILEQALAEQGYSVIDREYARKNRIEADYTLTLTVHHVSNNSSYGGANAYRGRFSLSGNGNSTGGRYQISIAMTNKDGRNDPKRSAIMDVDSTVQWNANGYVTLSNVSGYGGHSYYATDPMNAAAQEAINHFFGLTQ